MRKTFRFSTAEVTILDQRAADLKMSPSECIRHLILHETTQTILPNPPLNTDHAITVSFSPSELTVLNPFAEKTQLPLPEYVRRLVLKIAQKWVELKGDDPQQAMLKKEVEDKVLTPLGTREPSQE